jgi:lipopolysaccharide biosynthesis glycosyltransferase
LFPPDPVCRIPENCAHNSINKPTQVPTYTDSSPRPYKLLNSGTVVLTPSKTTDAALERFFLHRNAKQIEKYTFRDQDLLADWFAGRWKPLPWYYNALITLSHAHKPIWEDSEVRCLHYIGYRKPWAGRKAGDAKYQRFVDWWWTIFDGLEEELSDYPADWELLLRNTTPSG